ncbi:amino acid ABC transporter permease [Enterococcus sp. RIT-PI-f]|uniref:amino acid ABC transporter permease n=1 Tax=Enterococcus sp. RIT-PI-f TaxID=1690244 RepID=UPI0006BA09D9|nr:amino acid ABC transporter permease [Enterococcus sp. RIT-PI-f]KPG71300.1 hypothetical protein AEQ18_03770 [Enterococcus sp. RIT-PI-f]
MTIDTNFLFQTIRTSLGYLPVTINIAGISFLLSFMIGLLFTWFRIFHVPFLNQFATIYITIFKGVPVVLVLLFSQTVIVNYLDQLIGEGHSFLNIFDNKPEHVAIFALTIVSITGTAEALKAGIDGISKGQWDAAQSIGFSQWQAFSRIILPQALLGAMPILGNQLIGLVKASSLVSMVGVIEIYNAAIIKAGQGYNYLEAYLAIAVIYWFLSVLIEQGIRLAMQISKVEVLI